MDNYRIEIKNLIIQKSDIMTNICIFCCKEENKSEESVIDWIQCDKCKRWAHTSCYFKSTEKLNKCDVNDLIYKCFNCNKSLKDVKVNNLISMYKDHKKNYRLLYFKLFI